MGTKGSLPDVPVADVVTPVIQAELNLLLSHRLDISDEFKQVISTLKGHDDKVSNTVTVLVMYVVLAGVMPMLLL
jgi:hypothetical protein